MTKRSLSLLSLTLCVALGACDDSSSDSDPQGDATTGGEQASSTSSTPTTNEPEPGETDPGDSTSTDPGTSGPTSEGEDEESGDPTTGPEDTDDETTGEGGCRDTGVPCEDEMILDLGLVGGSVSDGAISNTADGNGWTTAVDATAGGIVDAPSNPWVYLRFTDDGLEKLDIDDLQALGSDEWDIAAKRFGIRLNSGSSGPGCVGVATLVDDEFDAIDSVPDDATFQTEAFYDDACGLIDDGSGVGAANYALTPWWFYPGCVGVTYVPFVIETVDGRHVKFMVEAYYESGQAECNDSGAMGSGSANFTWRWAYLD